MDEKELVVIFLICFFVLMGSLFTQWFILSFILIESWREALMALDAVLFLGAVVTIVLILQKKLYKK